MKKIISLALALILMLALVPMTAAVGAADDFEIKNGVLVKYKGPGGDVVIPNSVNSIGREAFLNCTDLINIIIPDSVIHIGISAFSHCENLKSVIIPDSVTAINDKVFYKCTSLTSVTIPNSVTSIGENAFWYCESLISVTLPDSVTFIGREAFTGCKSLKSATIPDSVTSIGQYAFINCPSLTIYGVSGSEAEKYANEYYINFKLIDAPDMPATPVGASGATNSGNTLGSVLHTDIKAYINGNAIPSYNINGNTAVVVEDLEYYGFKLDWNASARTISVISYDANKTVKPLAVSESTGATGSVAFPYVYTDIKAYINGIEVRSYNINGKTCIIIDDLKAYGRIDWDNSKREIRLTVV